jgi:hypothetical protein
MQRLSTGWYDRLAKQIVSWMSLHMYRLLVSLRLIALFCRQVSDPRTHPYYLLLRSIIGTRKVQYKLLSSLNPQYRLNKRCSTRKYEKVWVWCKRTIMSTRTMYLSIKICHGVRCTASWSLKPSGQNLSSVLPSWDVQCKVVDRDGAVQQHVVAQRIWSSQ